MVMLKLILTGASCIMVAFLFDTNLSVLSKALEVLRI